jgi:hypothetical protein
MNLVLINVVPVSQFHQFHTLVYQPLFFGFDLDPEIEEPMTALVISLH